MFLDRYGQPKCNLIILVTKKIGLDVVNLDFIFNVKCDHFSICPSKEVKSQKLAYHFISFIKNNYLTSFEHYSLF